MCNNVLFRKNASCNQSCWSLKGLYLKQITDHMHMIPKTSQQIDSTSENEALTGNYYLSVEKLLQHGMFALKT